MRRDLLAAGTAVAVLAAAVSGLTYVRADQRAQSHKRAERLASDFLLDWAKGKWSDAAALTVSHGVTDPAGYLSRTAVGLHDSSLTLTRGVVSTRKAPYTADFHAHMVIQGLGTYDYDGVLALTKPKRLGWRVLFNEASVNPALQPGDRLVRVRSLGTRGRVLTETGTPLADADGELSANVVGSVSPMTSAEATAKGGRALAGDPVGRSGLEKALESTLAATAQGSVAVVDAAGKVTQTLKTYTGTDGKDVKTTFDLAIQAAGERALAGVKQPAALVAIDTRTGAVSAIVNHPLGGFPRAVVGAYPPGSTFKIITSTAGLLAGKTASSSLSCPKDIKVDGRTFVNAEKEELGTISFLQAFAQSCNTAFAGLVQSLPVDAVAQASKLFGFSGSRDTPGPLTIPGLGGFFPTPDGYATDVGQSIGQDGVVVSPVQMASVAAAVSAGQWRQPYLTDPAPAGLAHHDIPVAATLRQFMSAVVTEGTAKAAGLPGGTFGKTGTAEFGPGPPYKTHAWFVGYRGNTAFAIVIEGGGFGGVVAAPIAAQFLGYL